MTRKSIIILIVFVILLTMGILLFARFAGQKPNGSSHNTQSSSIQAVSQPEQFFEKEITNNSTFIDINRNNYQNPLFKTIIDQLPEIATRFKSNEFLIRQFVYKPTSTSAFELIPANIRAIREVTVNNQVKWVYFKNDSLFVANPRLQDENILEVPTEIIKEVIDIQTTPRLPSTVFVQFATNNDPDSQFQNTFDYGIAKIDVGLPINDNNYYKEYSLTDFNKEIVRRDESLTNFQEIISQVEKLNNGQSEDEGTDHAFLLDPSWHYFILPSGKIILWSQYYTSRLWHLISDQNIQNQSNYAQAVEIPESFETSVTPTFAACQKQADICWTLDTEKNRLVKIDFTGTEPQLTKLSPENSNKLSNEAINASLEVLGWDSQLFFVVREDMKEVGVWLNGQWVKLATL